MSEFEFDEELLKNPPPELLAKQPSPNVEKPKSEGWRLVRPKDSKPKVELPRVAAPTRATPVTPASPRRLEGSDLPAGNSVSKWGWPAGAALLAIPVVARILRTNPDFLGGPLVAYPVGIVVGLATGLAILWIDPRIRAAPKVDEEGREAPEPAHWVIVGLALATFFIPVVNWCFAGAAMFVTRKHRGLIRKLAWSTIGLSTIGMVAVFALLSALGLN